MRGGCRVIVCAPHSPALLLLLLSPLLLCCSCCQHTHSLSLSLCSGHIHHIDNSFGFDQRFPYRTPIQVGGKITVILSDSNCHSWFATHDDSFASHLDTVCVVASSALPPVLLITCHFAVTLLLNTTAQGLYSASAGTHPGGSVMGCAGHNAAGCVVKDLGLKPWWPTAAV